MGGVYRLELGDQVLFAYGCGVAQSVISVYLHNIQNHFCPSLF